MKRTLGILLFAAVAVLAFSPRRTEACPNVTYLQLDDDTKKVKAADDALANGDLARAKERAKSLRFYSIQVGDPDHALGKELDRMQEKHNVLLRRAARIVALATVRDPSSSIGDRETCVRVLLTYLKADPNPALEADAAEALASVPEKEPLALMMLRGLAKKDLMGSAYAYAALARLEAARGNDAEAASADERCKQMAKRASICARPGL
jgi:hypothetical protein